MRSRMLCWSGWVLSLLLLLAQPVTALAEGQDQDLPSSGPALFSRLCASCHGIDGAGDGPAAASLRKAPPDLRTISARRDGRFDAREVAAIVDGRMMPSSHGSGEMPIWGCLHLRARPGEEGPNPRMQALVGWLEAIQRPD